jgi:phage terminase large subunit
MIPASLPEKFAPLFEPSRYKAFFGGRGGAKSRSFARALILKGTQEKLRILCAREIQKSIGDSVKKVLEDEIERLGLSKFYRSTLTHIFGINGTVFNFSGLRSNIDSIKSMEGINIVWVEEANTVSQESLTKLIPTIRTPGSEIWFSWNPEFDTDPVDAMFRGELPPPNAIIQEVHYFDNPWFPEVLREEMEWCKARDLDAYNHIWLGGYKLLSEARVFKNWMVEEFVTPERIPLYFGADWGFSVDPTTLVRTWLDIPDRRIYIDYEAWSIKCEIDDTPALFDRVPESRRFRIRADSARPETISYMKRSGFRITGARKGAGSVEEGVKFLQNYDIVVHPRCRHVIDELTNYKYKVDKHTGEILPILEDKKNHTIDALRYALEEVRNGGWFTAA